MVCGPEVQEAATEAVKGSPGVPEGPGMKFWSLYLSSRVEMQP